MKRINKFALFILGALSFASCSDINDIESEGYRITGEQIDDATSVIPSRVEAKIADRKSTRLNSSHMPKSRMPSSA